MQQRFDGFSIDSYQLRFSGSVDLESTDGPQVQYGEDVYLVVRATVKQVLVQETASGDTRRVNVAKPQEVGVVLNAERQQALADEFGLSHPGPTLPFETPVLDSGPSLGSQPAPDPDKIEEEIIEFEVEQFDGTRLARTFSRRDARVAEFLAEADG